MIRIYFNAEWKCGQELILSAAITHRILHVLRLKIGDQLILFHGADGEFQATITAMKKNSCTVTIEKFIPKNIESPLHIHLGQVISRGEKMDYTIQKATELGVTAITPLFSEHCNVRLNEERTTKRLEHWQATAIAASEQCGRCFIPKIFPAENLEEWLQKALPGTRIILDHRSPNKIKNISLTNEIVLLVGPEGGFSDHEILLAKQNNFIPVQLGPRILRTETAALAAISALQTLKGDW